MAAPARSFARHVQAVYQGVNPKLLGKGGQCVVVEGTVIQIYKY